MFATLFLGIICLLISIYVKDKKKGLQIAFFLGTVFLAIRYGWGNDYMKYLSDYNYAKTLSFGLFDIEAAKSVQRHSEWIWLLLNRLFYISGLGFFGLVITLSIFESWTIYRLVEKYVNPKYFWVAVLFWIFSKSFCVNASMMRQFLCVCLYLVVVELMMEKKVKFYYLWAIGIILVGSYIHRSFLMTIVSLPFFYVHVAQKRSSMIWSIIVGILFILWTIFGRSYVEPLMIAYLEESEDFSSYMSYVDRGDTRGIISGLGVLFNYVTFATWLWLLPKMDKRRQPLVVLLIFSYFFNVVTDIVPLAGRLSLYFSMLGLLCWAFLFEYGKKWNGLYVIFALQLVILVRDFFHFFHDPLWRDYFYEYHTILEVGKWL